MEINEQALIAACQKGELDQFGPLYDRYVKKIFAFVYYKTHHRETAEDLVSKTFLKAIERIASFDPGKGTFQSWLYQIARNTVIDHYRTDHPAGDIADVWDLSDGTDLVRDTDIKMKLEVVDQYLRILKRADREIIIMRVWDGLSHKEIAAILGKSEASVKMAYSRALQALREMMPAASFALLFLAHLLFK